MSSRLTHKRKVSAKKFGRHLTRYAIAVQGESLFKKPVGSGKNKIRTVYIGIATESGSGKSIISMVAARDVVVERTYKPN